jgi:hypothetical protein
VLNGVYRKVVTQEELLAAGLFLAETTGVYGIQTLTFDDGRFIHSTKNNPNHPPECAGTYMVTGSYVVLEGDSTEACGTASGRLLFSATWALKHGELSFDVDAGDDLVFARAFWGSKPWKKIG